MTARQSTARGRYGKSNEIDQLRAQVRQLEAERDSLRNAAAMAAHELMKPVILAEACAFGILDREQSLATDSLEDLQSMLRASSAARVTAETVMLYANGRERPVARRSVDLSRIVQDCLVVLGRDIESRHSHIDVEPLPVVRGDEPLLYSVFGNLLANAVRYGAADRTVKVSARRAGTGWMLCVESGGPAISASDRERIFEPWVRGRSVRRAGGSGLGLALVRQLVERHGGVVGVTSPDAHTNRFFFTLPA